MFHRILGARHVAEAHGSLARRRKAVEDRLVADRRLRPAQPLVARASLLLQLAREGRDGLMVERGEGLDGQRAVHAALQHDGGRWHDGQTGPGMGQDGWRDGQCGGMGAGQVTRRAMSRDGRRTGDATGNVTGWGQDRWRDGQCGGMGAGQVARRAMWRDGGRTGDTTDREGPGWGQDR